MNILALIRDLRKPLIVFGVDLENRRMSGEK
jgi:hypothetical protein